jgi:hypothetical protein
MIMTDTFETAKPDIETRSIDAVRPYWRNPRDIPAKAVDAVMDSIRRYGYQQPIIVDKDGVIIVGHTRYAALRRLGADQIHVIVADLAPQAAREYRVMDNKVSEFSAWNHDALVAELREFEESLSQQYFPDVDLEVGEITEASRTTADEIEKATESIRHFGEAAEHGTTTVICPACFHEFELRSDTA